MMSPISQSILVLKMQFKIMLTTSIETAISTLYKNFDYLKIEKLTKFVAVNTKTSRATANKG